MSQKVKNHPSMQEIQEMWVWFQGLKDPLEEETGFLSRESHGQEDPGWLHSKGSQRAGHNWAQYNYEFILYET